MAKTDSFFIRQVVSTDGVNFVQEAIDLGAYVDALGKSVLRIHNISVQYGAPGNTYAGTANSAAASFFALTTQSQTAVVDVGSKSVIASGKLAIASGVGAGDIHMSEALDVAPQHWTNGYLVGVEQIYLGVDQFGSDLVDQIGIVLECTVETLSSSAAMALALSQQ